MVLGSPVPMPLAESPSSVLVLPVEANVLSLESEQELLRQDSSVFLEQRGAGGGQADIVLRGGTFEQTLVLLNGFRIDDSQTAHHNLDLPVPLDAMDSIEVLHGAGSTLHGVDALSGVVDFLTAAPTATTLRLRAGGGSFGSEEESLLGTLVHKRWSSRLTADRDFSTGFMTDRDYRNEDSSLESWASSRLGVTDLLAAVSDRSFGANQFYGPYDSWERTKGWFASGAAGVGQPHGGGLRLPAAHGRVCAAAQRSVCLRKQPHRRLVAGLAAPYCARRIHVCAFAGARRGWGQHSQQQSWTVMRAIAALATLTWICGRQRSGGICLPECARRFFQAECSRCCRRIWRGVCG